MPLILRHNNFMILSKYLSNGGQYAKKIGQTSPLKKRPYACWGVWGHWGVFGVVAKYAKTAFCVIHSAYRNSQPVGGDGGICCDVGDDARSHAIIIHWAWP